MMKTYKMNFINQKINKKKVLNFVLTLGKSRTFCRVLERQNMQIQTIFELHNDDNNSKYSKDILKSTKKIMKNLRQANFHS